MWHKCHSNNHWVSAVNSALRYQRISKSRGTRGNLQRPLSKCQQAVDNIIFTPGRTQPNYRDVNLLKSVPKTLCPQISAGVGPERLRHCNAPIHKADATLTITEAKGIALLGYDIGCFPHLGVLRNTWSAASFQPHPMLSGRLRNHCPLYDAMWAA